MKFSSSTSSAERSTPVRNILGIALVGAAVAVFASFPSKTVSHEGTPAGHAVDKPVLETLLKTKLAGVEGTEVIVSRVSFPPNTSLPKHWHPGEEFAYVIEGSVILWQDGKDEIVVNQGEVAAVPLRQVHTAITKEQGVTLLVFRVHAEGQPERVLVE
jgi:quercetin dioxygenase-like cupin family protein